MLSFTYTFVKHLTIRNVFTIFLVERSNEIFHHSFYTQLSTVTYLLPYFPKVGRVGVNKHGNSNLNIIKRYVTSLNTKTEWMI